MSCHTYPLEHCGVKGPAQGPNSCADLIVARPVIGPPNLRVQVKHSSCFPGTISVLILKYSWGHCLVGRSTYGQISASWQRQRFLAKMPWYLVEFIMPLILTRAPGPLQQNTPKALMIHHHSSYASLFWQETCWWCTWPKRSILVSSDHSTLFHS